MTVHVFTNPQISKHELNLISESLENQTVDTWKLNPVDECIEALDLVVLVSSGVTFTSLFIEELLKASSSGQSRIFYFDRFSISHGQKIRVKPPIWSPMKFINTNFLGPVIAFKQADNQKILSYEELAKNLGNFVIEGYFNSEFFSLCQKPVYFESDFSDSREVFTSKVIFEQIKKFNNKSLEENLILMNETMSVEIVIPTRLGKFAKSDVPAIYSCLESINKQEIKNLQISISVVLDENSNSDDKASFLEYCDGIPNLKVKLFYDKFNFSQKCNVGIENSTSDVAIFLNDDAEFMNKDALLKLAFATQIDSIGAVGALLFYPDGSLQHAGHVYRGGNVAHAYLRMLPFTDPAGDLEGMLEVSSVTGACIAVRTPLLKEIGNWNEDFPNSFNDIDLCLRLRKNGFSIIQHNQVKLIHHESISRDPLPAKGDLAKLKALWMKELFEENFLRSDIAFEGNPAFYEKPESAGLLYYSIRTLQGIKNEGLARTTFRILDFGAKKLYASKEK